MCTAGHVLQTHADYGAIVKFGNVPQRGLRGHGELKLDPDERVRFLETLPQLLINHMLRDENDPSSFVCPSVQTHAITPAVAWHIAGLCSWSDCLLLAQRTKPHLQPPIRPHAHPVLELTSHSATSLQGLRRPGEQTLLELPAPGPGRLSRRPMRGNDKRRSTKITVEV